MSLASAQAAFDRLTDTLGGAVTPSDFLTLDDAELRRIGFSRQKAGYARDLAHALEEGFALEPLASLTDDDVRAELIAHRGIGRWTADIYLTMCLLRDDVWPNGDLALATAAGRSASFRNARATRSWRRSRSDGTRTEPLRRASSGSTTCASAAFRSTRSSRARRRRGTPPRPTRRRRATRAPTGGACRATTSRARRARSSRAGRESERPGSPPTRLPR